MANYNRVGLRDLDEIRDILEVLWNEYRSLKGPTWHVVRLIEPMLRMLIS